MIKNHITKRELQDAGYVVTEYGAVWSHKGYTAKPLKVVKGKNDRYKSITLSFRKGRKCYKVKYLVHRLVCIWFHGDAPTQCHVVNHIDGDTLNNHKDNLEWCTQSENVLKGIDRRKGL